MLLTNEIVYERIKDSGYPFWTLYLQQGFKNTSHLMTYTGNDFEENDSDETKLQKSIARLDNIVNSIQDATFVIEIKNSKTANGNGIIGPLQFSNTVKKEEVTPTLSGGSAISESYLKGIEERISREFNQKFETWKAEEKQKQYEKELEKREEELKEKEKELDDLKKGYESGVTKTADILLEAGKRIAMYFVPDLQAKTAATPEIQLSGKTQQSDEEQFEDEKASVINEFAEYLYNGYSKEQIKELLNNIKNYNNGLDEEYNAEKDYASESATN